jgi:hypothetical protein
MRRETAAIVFGGVLLTIAFAGVSAASARESAIAKARITSVAFRQLSSPSPEVIIHGSGFGSRPAPNPSFRPTPPNGNTPPYGCSATGKVGWDYGTQLWLSVTSTSHAPWAAGRYRPKLQELDCIGLTLLKYTGNQVVYRLAAGYHAGGFQLTKGDHFTASVKGSIKRGLVG